MKARVPFPASISSRVFDGGLAPYLLTAAATGCAGSLLLAVFSSAVSPVTAAVAVLGVAIAAGMVGWPAFAVAVLCLSLPFERIGRLTNDSAAVGVSSGRILGLVALAGLLVHATLRKKKLRFGVPF
jgi:hypothetical protein